MPTILHAAVPLHESIKKALLIAGPAVRESLSVRQARPPAYHRHAFRGSGVRQSDGSLHGLGASRFRNLTYSPDPADPQPVPQAQLLGTSLFGGMIGNHFGHTLTQSLGRLWAGQIAPDAPILFLPETPDVTSIPGYFIDVVRSLGVQNPLLLVACVTECERLLLAQDICNLKHRPSALPFFAQWLTRNRPFPAQGGSPLVYISRSGLDLSKGQFLQERPLEQALAANGYAIFHPEAHPISHQIEVYAAAKRLIFADGSAMHLWSLVAQPDQKVAVILRRPAHRHFGRWFKSLECPRPKFVDCGIADFSHHRKGAFRSVALLDLAETWSRLRDLGFHRDQTGPATDRTRLVAWVASLERGFSEPGPPPFPIDARSLQILALCGQVTLRSGIDKPQ